MSQKTAETTPQQGKPATQRPSPRSRRALRATGLVASAAILAAFVVLSIGVGARPLWPGEVWHGLVDPDSPVYTVVHQLRLPRTLLGLLAGAALGPAGALMQALTRNPLGDPGVLGINAGASAAVATASAFLGVATFSAFVWFALIGAAAVAVLIYAVGGGRSATPVRLALAGAGLNAALYSYVTALMLLDNASLDRLRFWTVGTLADADPATVLKVLPFVATGLVLAIALARPLNVVALGDDAARALGSRPGLIRAGSIVAITLLCGSATAACGPIVFVGLLVPHLLRRLAGTDLRWLLPYCALLAPVLLLGADVLGRVLGSPGELQVGVVTAALGGLLFLNLVHRGKASAS
ncbi:FecCD family ABC transporter permease [Amycolatopsis taiwanensis]|uniref:FecCD family ABC transporter permease n=1 Tax=Amycolatopsis taiwanensis TaxID=342230 RepID=UPI0004AE52B9|nr:iron chelate uptake ABC transporter family permease subunit [Amycolatopsis taiwanensis]